MISTANRHDFEGQFQRDCRAIGHPLQDVENEANQTEADVKILNNFQQKRMIHERLSQPKTSNERLPNMNRSLNHN